MNSSLEPAGAVADLRDEERQPCEIWTRVMGYHRPVSSFNRGKQGEHQERVTFRFASDTSCAETV